VRLLKNLAGRELAVAARSRLARAGARQAIGAGVPPAIGASREGKLHRLVRIVNP